MPEINGRPASAFADFTTVLQSAAAATGNGTALAVQSGDVVRLKTVGATVPNAVVTYEWSDDGGTTWYNAFVQDLLAAAGLATMVNTVAVATSAAHGLWEAPPGATSLRGRVSTYVAGTVTVTAITRRRS